MPTPLWQPGTIYPPGSIVQPASAPAPQPDPLDNGGFEEGNTGWTSDAGFSIGEFGNGTHFQGTWSLQWDLTGEGHSINNEATEVVPGQTINGSCQVQQGASSSGQAGARVEILWYDASDEFLSSSLGNMVNSTSNQNWKQSSVSAVAPAGAAFARFAVFAFRLGGGDELWVDNCTWDALVSNLPSGLVFKAVQAVAGYSGSSEPTWPLVNGQTVVDNEVTWEAVFASRVVWEAAPVLVSGPYEPEWPTTPGGEVADGTIRWVAMNWRVTDPKCPQGPIVAIGASKIFCADDDIIPFSATTNPLDWSSEEDAGFLPFGLQTYGSNPVRMLGLYRSNLLAFNAEAYQMWQIDEDPANMAFLDASPVPCTHYKSGQPVSNDFALVTPVGVRSIGIAGASTNLQAGYFGAQIDPLVLAKLLEGEAPISLTWPAAGQFWAIFDDEAFVLTMNGGTKDWSWSRYTFPTEGITDWAILEDDLYLRTVEGYIWVMDVEELDDDATCPGAAFIAGASAAASIAFTAADAGEGAVVGCFPPTGVISDTFTTAEVVGISTDGVNNRLRLTLSGVNGGARPPEDYFETFVLEGPSGVVASLTVGDFVTSELPGNERRWDYTYIPGDLPMIDGEDYTLTLAGGGLAGTGYTADYGTLVSDDFGDPALVSVYTAGDDFVIELQGIDEAPAADYFTVLTVSGPDGLSADLAIGDFSTSTVGNLRQWTYTFTPDALLPFTLDAEYSIALTGDNVECTGTPFEGYIAWPYLDFGILGQDKNLEGFDVAADGTFRVSVGWSQKNFALATPDYAIDGDTLTGDMVPLPLTAPSFQFRLTFDASQSWEWQASSIYIL
jgi:hypothetical protein